MVDGAFGKAIIFLGGTTGGWQVLDFHKLGRHFHQLAVWCASHLGCYHCASVAKFGNLAQIAACGADGLQTPVPSPAHMYGELHRLCLTFWLFNSLLQRCPNLKMGEKPCSQTNPIVS